MADARNRFSMEIDGQPHEFVVVVNVAAIRRCRERVGIDLYKLFDEGSDSVQAALQDPPRLCDLAFCLVEQQAGYRNIDANKFGGAFSGDALFEAARALTESIVDFFPKSQREKARRLLAMTEAAGQQTAETILSDVESLGAEGLANAALKDWKKSFAALRASAGVATQAPTPSGN